jgi:signal transduction histidine kinase
LIAYGIVVILTASDIQTSLIQWSRYLLLLPGGTLAAIGFIRQWLRLKQAENAPPSAILLATGVAFLVNAFFTGAVTENAGLSSEHIATLTSIPIETWRLLMILLLTLLVTRSMHVFEVERQQEIERLEEARREAQKIALTIHTKTRQQAEAWLDALVKIGHRIASMDEADDVLKDVVARASDMLMADAAAIALYEPGGKLGYKVQFTSGEARVLPSETVENPLILEAVAAGAPMRYPDDFGGGAFEWDAGGKTFRAETAAVVPLRLNTTLIGALWLGRSDGARFTCTDLIGLGYIANQAVIALEHASMAAGLQSLAVIEERARIAREMHDSLAQILGYLGLETQTLEALVRQGDQEAVLAELKEARQSIKSAQADVRENIISLRTVFSGKADLISALKEYVVEFGIQTGVETVIEDHAGADLMLSPLVETQCVRIVQEALTNIRKHARARHVQISLVAMQDRLEIHITDDGVGMTPGTVSRGHFGLQTMRERADSVGGTLTITSQPNQGTSVTLSLPLLYQEIETENYAAAARIGG